MSTGVSCGIVGAGAERLARAALRGRRDAVPPLLVVVTRAAAQRMPALPPRRRVRRAAAELAAALPDGVLVRAEGPLVVVRAQQAGAGVAGPVLGHAGSLAVALEGPRDAATDALLRAVDELVLVEPAAPGVRELAERELAQLGPVSVVPAPGRARGGGRTRAGRVSAAVEPDAGQTTVAVVAILAVVIAVAAGLGIVASALGRGAGVQGRADVAALAGARAMLDAQPALFASERAQRIDVAEYRRRAEAAARASARANDLRVERVELLGPAELPTRVRVTATAAGARDDDPVRSTAEVAVGGDTELASGGGYSGPLAVRQGQRMRPDVAVAFDRMDAAARGAGVTLVIASAFRSDAEQARLFAANPDPKWVAPPGKSLHRLATELDLGPAAAYGWLATYAGRFGFIQRYSWEPWHYGYTRSAGSASVGYTGGSGAARSAKRADRGAEASGEDGEVKTKQGGGNERSGSAIPSFVPAAYAPLIAKAAQRWSVGGALLGAQLQVESGFNPRAVSPAGAAGIAQFMPATAAAYGLTPAERFDPAKAIDAQAHHMHDLLRQLASVPLALAAYNAGGGAVSRCMCVPPYPETQAYVQKILRLLGGAGLAAPAGFEIRLVA